MSGKIRTSSGDARHREGTRGHRQWDPPANETDIERINKYKAALVSLDNQPEPIRQLQTGIEYILKAASWYLLRANGKNNMWAILSDQLMDHVRILQNIYINEVSNWNEHRVEPNQTKPSG